MSDNSNDVHFSGVRFICSPYLAIKSALALLGSIMARCGPQMNLCPQNEYYCYITRTTECQSYSICMIPKRVSSARKLQPYPRSEEFQHETDSKEHLFCKISKNSICVLKCLTKYFISLKSISDPPFLI